LMVLIGLLLNGAFLHGPHRAWTLLGKQFIASQSVFLDAWSPNK
jgi:hypothetical protein